jgi:hypothetical protein
LTPELKVDPNFKVFQSEKFRGDAGPEPGSEAGTA